MEEDGLKISFCSFPWSWAAFVLDWKVLSNDVMYLVVCVWCLGVWVHVCHGGPVWTSVLSFPHAGPRDGTQVVSLRGRCLYPQPHLVCYRKSVFSQSVFWASHTTGVTLSEGGLGVYLFVLQLCR